MEYFELIFGDREQIVTIPILKVTRVYRSVSQYIIQR